jgi:hypothetical protein
LQGDTDVWTWWIERPDGTSSASEREFPSLNACVADARQHGYVMRTPAQERRAEPTRPPLALISQDVWCPKCKHMWQLYREELVSRGDAARCRSCGHEFTASAETVTCCVEDGEGLREVPLQ